MSVAADTVMAAARPILWGAAEAFSDIGSDFAGAIDDLMGYLRKVASMRFDAAMETRLAETPAEEEAALEYARLTLSMVRVISSFFEGEPPKSLRAMMERHLPDRLGEYDQLLADATAKVREYRALLAFYCEDDSREDETLGFHYIPASS
jgi:hypothetical protein